MVPRNFPGKHRGKKIEMKNRNYRKIKINLKSINYFYILFQTYFTYFNSSI